MVEEEQSEVVVRCESVSYALKVSCEVCRFSKPTLSCSHLGRGAAYHVVGVLKNCPLVQALPSDFSIDPISNS